ncbi:MAG TPA: GlsB/YeaQ/YmgE family stress response membrane protein [Acidisarcina sp.]
MFILWWIIVGLIAGFITGKLMKGSGYGPVMDIVVGIVGAVIGGYIMRALGHSDSGGLIYTVFVAVIGAVLLTLLIRLVTRGRVSNI